MYNSDKEIPKIFKANSKEEDHVLKKSFTKFLIKFEQDADDFTSKAYLILNELLKNNRTIKLFLKFLTCSRSKTVLSKCTSSWAIQKMSSVLLQAASK